jgi:YHS domain-containing protein
LRLLNQTFTGTSDTPNSYRLGNKKTTVECKIRKVTIGGEKSLAKDLICGMTVDEKTAKYKSDYKGKTYYFCSQSCKTKFDKNPSKFAGT